MTTSVSARIRRALLGLALGLSALFTLLALLLLYVTEDKIFANHLRAEQTVLEQLSEADRTQWRPASRQMEVWWSSENLPKSQRAVVGDKPGVYEYFDGPVAYFILKGNLPDSKREYYITYDVSLLLAVRHSRPALLALSGISAMIVAICAIFVALYLANLTLRPLRALTRKLSSGSAEDLPSNFAANFGRDEVGLLAEALAEALDRTQASARREFEFNQGVSHELRSPIQVAKNASELIHMVTQEAEKSPVSEPLKRLDRAIEQMENLTEAFLWLASNRKVSDATTNARPEIEKLVCDYQYLLQGRSVQVEIEPDELAYEIPPAIFAVAVGNLLRNAIGHSDVGPLRCTLTARKIVIQNQAAVDAQRDKTAGFGMGLEIVDRVCKRQGWSLTLTESKDAEVRACINLSG